MLQYDLMYKISSGIFLTFKNPNKMIKSANSSEKSILKFKNIYPLRFCSEMTKDNFILLCIYLNYKKKPSSMNSFFKMLNEIIPNQEKNKDYQGFLKFKDEILNYKHYLIQDIKFLKENDESYSIQKMFNFYRQNNIRFYTFYFWIKSQNLENNINSRIINTEIKKIKGILQYVTFPEKIIFILKDKLTSIF